jgi:hypothetical protein
MIFKSSNLCTVYSIYSKAFHARVFPILRIPGYSEKCTLHSWIIYICACQDIPKAEHYRFFYVHSMISFNCLFRYQNSSYQYKFHLETSHLMMKIFETCKVYIYCTYAHTVKYKYSFSYIYEHIGMFFHL